MLTMFASLFKSTCCTVVAYFRSQQYNRQRNTSNAARVVEGLCESEAIRGRKAASMPEAPTPASLVLQSICVVLSCHTAASG